MPTSTTYGWEVPPASSARTDRVSARTASTAPSDRENIALVMYVIPFKRCAEGGSVTAASSRLRHVAAEDSLEGRLRAAQAGWSFPPGDRSPGHVRRVRRPITIVPDIPNQSTQLSHPWSTYVQD